MTDLGPLKCRGCGSKDLSLQPEDAVACKCGWQGHLRDVIRDYAKITGQWFIGGAMAVSVGFTQLHGNTRWAASAVGGTILLYAIGRVLWQAWTLRAARAQP